MSQAFDFQVDQTTNALVFDGFAEYVMETLITPNVYRSMVREVRWEERLRRAIEQRSIRYRLRAFRFEWTGRLSLAYDALRGRHFCVDDD